MAAPGALLIASGSVGSERRAWVMSEPIMAARVASAALATGSLRMRAAALAAATPNTMASAMLMSRAQRAVSSAPYSPAGQRSRGVTVARSQSNVNEASTPAPAPAAQSRYGSSVLSVSNGGLAVQFNELADEH